MSRSFSLLEKLRERHFTVPASANGGDDRELFVGRAQETLASYVVGKIRDEFHLDRFDSFFIFFSLWRRREGKRLIALKE